MFSERVVVNARNPAKPNKSGIAERLESNDAESARCVAALFDKIAEANVTTRVCNA
jgi:hypothetical protein